MDRLSGLLLVGFSLLTAAVVVMLGEIAARADEINGTYSSSWFDHIPWLVWVLLLIVLGMGLWLREDDPVREEIDPVPEDHLE
jgi:succinate dehydrogenase hydrophobic anchor subunit